MRRNSGNTTTRNQSRGKCSDKTRQTNKKPQQNQQNKKQKTPYADEKKKKKENPSHRHSSCSHRHRQRGHIQTQKCCMVLPSNGMFPPELKYVTTSLGVNNYFVRLLAPEAQFSFRHRNCRSLIGWLTNMSPFYEAGKMKFEFEW